MAGGPTLSSQALEDRRIGLIGAGAMGEALASGLLAAGVPRRAVQATDAEPARRERIAEKLGIATPADNRALVEASDIIVLAVKPAQTETVLADLAGEADLVRPLWISIAAGISLARLGASLPSRARVVRAMPNTPALIRAGATAFATGAHVTDDDRAVTRALFASVGEVWEAPAESLLDAVTGLSGSGPAYVFVFLEALGDAGVRMGLPRDAAYQLAFQTVVGAARLAQETGRHPGDLKDQVTSPGGTTIAGLERLEAGGFRAAIHDAVAAATARSRELGDT
jgi:pyrroline-5-carboxylate reductase